MSPERHRFHKPLVILGCIVAAATVVVVVAPWSRIRAEEEEYKKLSLDYLNPDFSPEFCAYWRIDTLQDYRRALDQQFKIARFEAFEEAQGDSEAELLHFVRLRMINWLERQLIERAERRLEFDRRGDTKFAPFSIDLHPLSEEAFKTHVPY